MTRELPFPIAFGLPDGWTLVSPDDSGQADAAYVAVRDTNTADPVAANLAISGLGLHDAAVDVAALAAAQLANLHAQCPVTVLKRDVMTTDPHDKRRSCCRSSIPSANDHHSAADPHRRGVSRRRGSGGRRRGAAGDDLSRRRLRPRRARVRAVDGQHRARHVPRPRHRGSRSRRADLGGDYRK